MATVPSLFFVVFLSCLFTTLNYCTASSSVVVYVKRATFTLNNQPTMLVTGQTVASSLLPAGGAWFWIEFTQAQPFTLTFNIMQTSWTSSSFTLDSSASSSSSSSWPNMFCDFDSSNNPQFTTIDPRPPMQIWSKGCFLPPTSSEDAMILVGSSFTVSACGRQALSYSPPYAYFSLAKGDECRVGTTFASPSLSFNQLTNTCNLPCINNASEICGASATSLTRSVYLANTCSPGYYPSSHLLLSDNSYATTSSSPLSFPLPSSWSVSVFTRIDTFDSGYISYGYQSVFEWGDFGQSESQYVRFGLTTKTAEVDVGSSSLSVNTAISLSVWDWWVVSYDSTSKSLCMYRNGAQLQCGTGRSLTLPSSAAFNLGISHTYGLFNNYNYYYAGAIDDVRVYSIALSSSVVSAQWSSQTWSSLASVSQSLLSFWSFEAGYGDYAVDMAQTAASGGTTQNQTFFLSGQTGATLEQVDATGLCMDVNECANENGGCDVRTQCTNLAGSFQCGPCPSSGYTGTGLTGCVDIDECLLGTAACEATSVCINTIGSYLCSPFLSPYWSLASPSDGIFSYTYSSPSSPPSPSLLSSSSLLLSNNSGIFGGQLLHLTVMSGYSTSSSGSFAGFNVTTMRVYYGTVSVPMRYMCDLSGAAAPASQQQPLSSSSSSTSLLSSPSSLTYSTSSFASSSSFISSSSSSNVNGVPLSLSLNNNYHNVSTSCRLNAGAGNGLVFSLFICTSNGVVVSNTYSILSQSMATLVQVVPQLGGGLCVLTSFLNATLNYQAPILIPSSLALITPSSSSSIIGSSTIYPPNTLSQTISFLSMNVCVDPVLLSVTYGGPFSNAATMPTPAGNSSSGMLNTSSSISSSSSSASGSASTSGSGSGGGGGGGGAGSVNILSFTCTILPPLTILNPSSPSLVRLSCLTQSNSLGQDLTVTVRAGASYVVTGTDTINYPAVPIIASVQGCINDPTQTSTYGCNTAGGQIITVTGVGFTLSAVVWVSGVAASFVSSSLNHLVVQVPSGTGGNQPVVVSVAQQFSAPKFWLSYAPPVISGLLGCNSPLIPVLSLENCPQSVYVVVTGPSTSTSTSNNTTPVAPTVTTITIQGSNFGSGGATVFIGAFSCGPGSAHGSGNSANSVYICVLPLAGYGLNQPILIIQKNGLISSSSSSSSPPATVSFAPCPAGSSQLPHSVGCSLCAAGFANSVLGAPCTPCALGYASWTNGSQTCVACAPGKYADVVGSVTCKLCEVGKASMEAAETCVPCAPGTATNVRGTPNQCTPCVPGKFQAQVGATSCDDCEPGTQSPSYGASTCNLCIGPSYSSRGAASCSSCPLLAIADPSHSTCLCDSGLLTSVTAPALVSGNKTNVGGNNSALVATTTTLNNTQPVVQCLPCPEGGVCSSIGLTLISVPAQVGYWRSSNLTTAFTSCLAVPDCQGGEMVADASCSQYRRGPTCALCIPGYYASSIYSTCTPCPSVNTAIVVSVFLCLCIIVAMIALFYVVLRADLDQETDETDDLTASDSSSSRALPRPLQHAVSGLRLHSSSNNNSNSNNNSRSPTMQDVTNAGAGADAGAGAGAHTNSVYESIGMHSRHNTELALGAGAGAGASTVRRRRRPSFSTIFESALLTSPVYPPIISHSSVSDTCYSPANALKIILSFIQIVSALSLSLSSLNVSWPTLFHTIIVTCFSFINFDIVPWQALGCVTTSIDYYTRLVIVTASPLLILLILLLVFILPSFLLDRHDMSDNDALRIHRQRSRQRFVRLATFTMFLLYPTVSATVLEAYACKQVEGKTYLVADFTKTCTSDEFRSWMPVVVVLTIIYPIGVPLTIAALLYYYRNQLHTESVRRALGFLYEARHPECAYFEVVDAVHKCLLCSVLRFFDTSSMQLSAGLFIVGAYTLLLLVSAPYVHAHDDRLHLLSQLVLFLLLLSANASFSSGSLASNSVGDVCLSLLLLTLCAVVCVCATMRVVVLTREWLWKKKREKVLRAAAEAAGGSQAQSQSQSQAGFKLKSKHSIEPGAQHMLDNEQHQNKEVMTNNNQDNKHKQNSIEMTSNQQRYQLGHDDSSKNKNDNNRSHRVSNNSASSASPGSSLTKSNWSQSPLSAAIENQF